MTTVTGVASGTNSLSGSPDDPVTVSRALSLLKSKPSSTVVIADTLENIQKNLDALQGVASKITSLSTTSATQKLTVSASQYAKDAAILAKWGAESGNTVHVSGVAASNAMAFVDAKADYVGTFSVSDSALNIQKNLDDLQTLVSGGSVTQIVQTGAAASIKITAAQLVANQDALSAIKNQAYTLAITGASVSDTFGLDGQDSLASNAKIKSIEVKDGTDAIEANLDALQRLGLRLKSISQTDAADNPLTVTATQYAKDKIAIGKILSPVQLDVIRASAAQAASIAANKKVVTVNVADTAANIAKKWSLLNKLGDDLTKVEVTDGATNAVTLSGDQVTAGEAVLAKFADDADHTYRLAVTGVKAGQAAAVANLANVTSVKITDSADNVVANLDDLATVETAGVLKGITLSGKSTTLAMDATRMQGAALAATQSVLDRISGGHYGLALKEVAITAIDDLADNRHVLAMEVNGSSTEIAASLDALHLLGKRVSKIQQSDAGEAIDVTQAQFESRASVLSRIDGGYSVNVNGVTASKAAAYAKNTRVASLTVADSGRNIAVQWNALRSIGDTLSGVAQTDSGALAVSAAVYLAGQNDGLLGKFDAPPALAVVGATVAQAMTLSEDTAVGQIDVSDEGSAVAASLSDLGDLLAAGKLRSMSLKTGATSIAMHASQLDGAQAVLDTISGGRYTLSLDEVEAAGIADLLASNAKIARIKVSGDAAGIAANLADLAGAGSKLQSIEQTDAGDEALALSGADFETYKTTLDKIAGGYQVDLSEVASAKAAALAANLSVNSLAVTAAAADLASTWSALGSIGAKLTGITQSDSALVQLTASQWAGVTGLTDKFTTTLGVSISNASVDDVAALAVDDAVQKIQLSDSAETISDAWSSLAAESKIDRLVISNPGTALTMSAATFNASQSLVGTIQGGYSVALSDVSVADAATLGADSHITAMDVSGSSADVATHFDELQALSQLGSITLSNDGGTLTLSSSQVLNGATTLGKIGNVYQIAATGVSLADLADVQGVDEVASVAIADSAANVSAGFDDLLALGGELSSIHLSDGSPLALTQALWASSTSTLARIDSSYQVDLSAVEAGSVTALAANATVHQLSATDTAAAVSSYWDALVAAYDEGNGKLTAITLSDSDPLQLTADQQTAGASMLAALLSDATIVTVS